MVVRGVCQSGLYNINRPAGSRQDNSKVPAACPVPGNMSNVNLDSETPRSRQQPGVACDECRRRKLRCDRGQPQCGVCRDTDTTCVTTTTRQPRGPRKGHLRALQSRIGMFASNLQVSPNQHLIVALEQRLSSEGLEDTGEDEFIRFPDETNTFPDQSFPDLVPAYSQDGIEIEGSNSSSTNGFGVDIVFSQPGSTMTLPLAGLSPINFISDLMRSDL